MKRLSTIRAIAMFLTIIAPLIGCEEKPASTIVITQQPAVQKTSYVTIGAGAVTGVYFPTAGAVAKMVSDGEQTHGIRATVESTGGSEYNVNAMGHGELDMGLVQSDVGYMAFRGEGDFSGHPVTKLRSIFSLHPEPFHIVARKEANVKTFADLKGKKVNIGNPGSGQRLTADELFSLSPFLLSDLLVEELKASEAADFLRDGRIDAFFYTVGIGSANIVDVAHSVPITIVGPDADTIERLKEGRPYYVTVEIPAGVYPGVGEPVTTFAVKATFLSTSDVSDEVVYQVVKSVFENFEAFKATHPALADLTHERMLEGLSAPLHPGAQRYYQERGWID